VLKVCQQQYQQRYPPRTPPYQQQFISRTRRPPLQQEFIPNTYVENNPQLSTDKNLIELITKIIMNTISQLLPPTECNKHLQEN